MVCHAEGFSLVPEGKGQPQRDLSRRQLEDHYRRAVENGWGVMILKTRCLAKGPINQARGGIMRF